MSDIIISGKQGSGKTDFAYQNFGGGDYELHDEMSLQTILEWTAAHPRPKYSKNRVFITQDEIDLSAGQRRFVIILMPDPS